MGLWVPFILTIVILSTCFLPLYKGIFYRDFPGGPFGYHFKDLVHDHLMEARIPLKDPVTRLPHWAERIPLKDPTIYFLMRRQESHLRIQQFITSRGDKDPT